MKTVQITLNQETINLVSTTFEINNDSVIDNDKLTQSITKAVFKRYEAQIRGLRTGLKPSKPFNFKVTIDNKLTLDLNTLAISAGMDGRIKINLHKYKKDANAAKQDFQSTLMFIITSVSEFNEDIKQAFN